MTLRLDTTQADFDAAFRKLCDMKREGEEDVSRVVRELIADVRARGDAALIELTERFDGVRLTAETFRISDDEIDEAESHVSPKLRAALETAAARIEAYHRRQMPEDARFTDKTGATLGWRWRALDSVGLYVPGGTANYPSSVLMNAVPARVAGVARIVMVTPARPAWPARSANEGTVNPATLVAAKIAGVREIYRIGGAQAIAALAYGTETIVPVDKIVGPGNAYVAAAKREVFGRVGIDSIAGPSEIVVVADGANDPAWIAADLLSQAEHDKNAQSILMTDDASFADSVSAEITRQLRTLDRREIAGASWRDNGAIIVVAKLADAPALVDALAPEHVEIATDDPEAIFSQIRHAGAVFLGRHTPEAIGDYIAGPNHVLPTARTARFSSGLGVLDFLKRTSILACDADALAALGPDALALAEAEGLSGHGRSISIRLNR